MTTQTRLPESGEFTADAVLGPFNIDDDPHRATPATLFASGSFGSGTIKVQVSPSGDVNDAVDLTGISLTAAGYKTLPLIQGTFFVVMSGSTSPTAKWWLQ